MEESETNSSSTSIGHHNNAVTSNDTDDSLCDPGNPPERERGEEEEEDANPISMDREQLERRREELRSGWKREPLKAFPREISPYKIFSLPGEEILWAREVPTANALLSTHGGAGSTSGEYFVLVLLALPIVSIMSIGMMIYLVFGQPQLRFMQILGFIFLPISGLLIWWKLMKTHVFSTRIDVITNRRVANLSIQSTSPSHLLSFISNLYSSSSSSFSSSSSSPLLRIQLNFLPLICIKEVVTLGNSGIRFSAHRDPSIRRENVPLLSQDRDAASTSLDLENQGDDDDEEMRGGTGRGRRGPPSLTEFIKKRSSSSTSFSHSNAVRLADETSKFLTGSIWFPWVRSPEELKTKISGEVDSLFSQRQHPNLLSSSPSPSSSSSSAVTSSTFTTPSSFGFQDTIPLSISSLPPAYQRTCDPILKEKDVMGLLWASRPLRLLRWLSTFNFTPLAIFCFSFAFTTLWLFFDFVTHISHSTSTPSDSSSDSSSSTLASSSDSYILWTIVCAFLSIGTAVLPFAALQSHNNLDGVDCVTETGFLLIRSRGGGDSVRALDVDFKDSFPWTVVLNTSSCSSSTSSTPTSPTQLRRRRDKKEEDTDALRTAMKTGEAESEEVEEPESQENGEPEVFADGYIHVWGVNNPPQTIPGIPERIIRAIQKVAMHRLLLNPPREEVEVDAEVERDGRGEGTGNVEQELEGEEDRGEGV